LINVAEKSRKQFVCLEAGCDKVIEASNDDQLIQMVQAHAAQAHNSFELDEFILAAAKEVAAE
jgi:predicted small metal-binding protein